MSLSDPWDTVLKQLIKVAVQGGRYAKYLKLDKKVHKQITENKFKSTRT